MDLKWKQRAVYRKMAVVAAISVTGAGALFLADNQRALPTDENGQISLQRNNPGGGSRKEELEVRVGNQVEEITVEIPEETMTPAEIQEAFEKAGAELETLICGENENLEEVRNNLNLIAKLPESGIAVRWELDNYEVMNLQGEIQKEAVNEDGTVLKLDAYLSYHEQQARYTFFAKLFPPKLSGAELWRERLKEELERLDEESKEDERQLLPMQLDGSPLEWRFGTEFRAFGILLLGATLMAAVYVMERQKEQKAEAERKRQLELDYPRLMNRLTLYLGAGMTVRKAWFKLAEDYQKREEKETRAVYEEMVYTMHEMQSGAAESACYERFGDRCRLTEYRKLGTLLSQNQKKGTKGVAAMLKQEALHSFEERERFARKMAEEVGTKLLIPMFLMFGMVLAIIVIPAFFTMQL